MSISLRRAGGSQKGRKGGGFGRESSQKLGENGNHENKTRKTGGQRGGLRVSLIGNGFQKGLKTRQENKKGARN